MRNTHPRIDRFVDWFINSEFFDNRRFGSSSDMWIEDPERAERCERAAEYGGDGSTHREIIDDWREAFRAFVRYGDGKSRRNPFSAGYARFESAVEAQFNSVEEWHTANGLIDQEVG